MIQRLAEVGREGRHGYYMYRIGPASQVETRSESQNMGSSGTLSSEVGPTELGSWSTAAPIQTIWGLLSCPEDLESILARGSQEAGVRALMHHPRGSGITSHRPFPAGAVGLGNLANSRRVGSQI
jgi:hypothetical protein